MKSIPGILFSLAIAGAFPAIAAVSAATVEWGKGPSQHLMTGEERAQWQKVTTEEQAQAFVNLFWARRDPTPTTQRNEFREHFEAAVKIADEKFSSRRTKGSMTDRGKVFLLLGGPSRVRSIGRTGGGAGSITDGTSAPNDQATPGTDFWMYMADRIPAFAAGKELEISFVDDSGRGEYKIGRVKGFTTADLIEKARRARIVSPSLNAVPSYGATVEAAPVVVVPQPAQTTEISIPAGQISPAVTSFTSAPLKIAVDEFRKAKPSSSRSLFVTHGEFVTPAGDYYIPLQLYVPAGSGLDAKTAGLTFFGVVEDSSGKVVSVYEEPATLMASRNDWFFDKSLTLSPGKYSGIFGLAREGKPLSMSRVALNLTGLDKDSAGISRLILSDNIYPLPAAQAATDPFAFGGIKVVPKGNNTFGRQDELWYFFELRNPGLDASSKPSVTMKLSVEANVDGKKKKFQPMTMKLDPQPLKGVPGRFGVGNSMPLALFEPGDYVIRLTVTDEITKRSYDLHQSFKIAGSAK